jgi:dephospho-CoA kinase
MLGEFGAILIDADEIAREVVAPAEPALAEIVRVFGESVLDAGGRLDRRRMRERIFADEHSRKTLESVLHPAIRARLLERLDAAATSAQPQSGTYVVAVVPLLVETGFAELVDRVLLVDCPPALQLERLIQRDAMTPDQAAAMLKAQADRETRAAAADDIIDNSHSVAWTRAQTWRVHLQYLKN